MQQSHESCKHREARGCPDRECTMPDAPHYDVDFYSDAFIADPLPHYAAMRALGPVVYLPQHDNFAIVRFRELREAMRDIAVFRSGDGVAGDAAGCTFLRGNTLASDPPVHDRMRTVMGAPLLPGALEAHRAWIEEEALALADRLCDRQVFDAMVDVARHLPLTIVTQLVGLPEDGRDHMLEWAAASFDILGIQNERGRQGIETIKEMRHWIKTGATTDRLKPDSWTARIAGLARDGSIPADMAPLLIRDYINPSLDTTISATGELLWQLARNPDQWDKLRADPGLIPRAVDEAVRLATPIRSFTRTTTASVVVADTPIPAGARVMMLFASANRDALHFADPDRFDVERRERDHVGFGHGIHMCVGMHLARLEMTALLKAFRTRIARFEADPPSPAYNNTIRSYAAMPMRIIVADRVADDRPATEAPRDVAAEASTGQAGWIDATIVDHRLIAETVMLVEFEAATGLFPLFEAGAHIDVEIRPGLVRQYSLCGPRDDRRRYRIAVHREARSRGGSIAVHDRFALGQALRISAPRNSFPLAPPDGNDAPVILIAGGIGITPILAMADQLHADARPFILIYRARSKASAAFADELAAAPYASNVRFAFDDAQEQPSDLPELGGCPNRKSVYCCGPAGLIDHVRERCRALGLTDAQLHVELFRAPQGSDDQPFTLHAARSGLTLTIPAGRSMLEVLEEAGVEVPSSCLSGICGTCLVDLSAGAADHRDQVQTEAEKSANGRVALCCSRALSPELVIDL
ncbi:hypothetical protein HY78_07345 [Rhizorhabdus wittichii DC-6]|nr:hypothetical protein HY78_07345 [Rhizorhabdus wittichii DC-6]